MLSRARHAHLLDVLESVALPADLGDLAPTERNHIDRLAAARGLSPEDTLTLIRDSQATAIADAREVMRIVDYVRGAA